VPRLLLLAPFAPRLEATHGGGRVLARFLTEITARHEVAVLCFREADEPGADRWFHERCQVLEEIERPSSRRVPRALRYRQITGALARSRPAWVADWWSDGFARTARAIAGRFGPDIVQAETHVMGQYLAGLGVDAPRVLVSHEAPGRAAPYLQGGPRTFAPLIHLLEARSWRRYETSVYRLADSIVVFTDEDRESVRGLAGGTTIDVIPPGAVLPEDPLDPLGRPPPRILFVGSFIHPPNVDAARRLIRSIFPAVRERIPEAKLLVVGDRPPEDLRAAVSDDVIVTGRVPDVTPYLDEAAVVVAPMHLGGGMRMKIVDALAAGKAIVATPLAVEGLGLRDGETVSIVADDHRMVGSIVDLLEHEDRRASLATRARAWADRHLGWDRTIEGYERLYLRLLGGSPDRSGDHGLPDHVD